MAEPVNRTILLLDIEKFGRRDDVEQAYMRRMLHSVVEKTLTAAGAEPTAQHREDRGDAVMVLISPEVPKGRLLQTLLRETPDLLRAKNRITAQSAQMRLRIVLDAGEVALDPHPGTLGGAVGHDLNQAFRLLDSDALRTALDETDSPSVLCVSADVYGNTVRHGHRGLDPREFHAISVTGKEGPLAAWVHAPAAVVGRHTPGERPNGQARALTGGSADFVPKGHWSGSLVMGDQHGVSGGQVTGDVVQGNKIVGGDAR